MVEDQKVTVVYQGEFRISDQDPDCLVTILGSCVAACLYDPVRRIGGVNHFLLPAGRGGDSLSLRYGINSMELLINGLLREGAAKDRLQSKIFGGAKMFGERSSIGDSNAAFAREFLEGEGIPIISSSLQGDQARKIRFWPTTGRVQQMLVRKSELDAVPKPPVAPSPVPTPDDGVELF